MQIAKFIFLLSILYGVGCGPTTSMNAVQSGRKDPVATESKQPTEVQINAAKNGHLTCEFEGECEPAIALISVATGTGVSRCTGFLISDHEVLTNDHCLSTIPDRENACQGLVFAHFTHDLHRSCKKISLRSHQNGINSKDYALIELNEPVKDRAAMRISKRGFKNHETATIFRVQTTQNTQTHNYDGIQTKLVCQASYSTIMDININSSKAPLMTFGDCAIQDGNSGSPILNENGEVGAINQGFLNVKEDSFSELLKPYLLDEGYGEVALGTQLRCIPELVGSIGNACEGLKVFHALYPKEYMNTLGGFSETLLPKLPVGNTWKTFSSTHPMIKNFISVPDCISNREVHSPDFSFTAIAMSYRLGINARLQAEWRSLYREGENEFLFVVQKNLAPEATFVDFTNSAIGTFTLPICTR